MLMCLADLVRRRINPEYTEYRAMTFLERKWYRTFNGGPPPKYMDQVKNDKRKKRI